ncbi:hypothetical protein [Krasilnikovia sp. MM14-A1259]|uniref:hypothetical protein n=1 Tax=Krasilnikovia sp. MM14-A1259 TaxID=3373539 RepID=UPI0038045865
MSKSIRPFHLNTPRLRLSFGSDFPDPVFPAAANGDRAPVTGRVWYARGCEIYPGYLQCDGCYRGGACHE